MVTTAHILSVVSLTPDALDMYETHRNSLIYYTINTDNATMWALCQTFCTNSSSRSFQSWIMPVIPVMFYDPYGIRARKDGKHVLMVKCYAVMEVGLEITHICYCY
jgi:hypothetical protein